MKKYLLLISGLLFSSSLALAGDWTGGDDLPTNPLPVVDLHRQVKPSHTMVDLQLGHLIEKVKQ